MFVQRRMKLSHTSSSIMESDELQPLTTFADPILSNDLNDGSNSCTKESSEEKKPRRKALLIAVQGNAAPPETSESSGEEDEEDSESDIPRPRRRSDPAGTGPLKGPHDDVRVLRELLMDKYSFAPEDIKVLQDDESLGEEAQPSKVNILKAISELVADASPDDRLVFVFAGHSLQKPADLNDDDEEDGLNEYIIASDGRTIKDNTLYKKLVLPLPAMCKLTAIFDSCHSGTLLDLKHHVCNRVFVPWVNKGQRRTRTLWYGQVRKQALTPEEARKYSRASPRTARTPSIRRNSVSSTTTRTSSTGKSSLLRQLSKRASHSKKLFVNTSNLVEVDENIGLTESPTNYSSPVARFCDGNCRNHDPSQWEKDMPQADVICLSSSQDSEKTWEDSNGKSMIQGLVEILRENQYPLLHDLMTEISHNIHRSYLDLHHNTREYKKKFAEYEERRRRTRAKKGKKREADKMEDESNAKRRKFSGEMTNFQTPELSSPAPLDMRNRRFSL